MDNVITVNAYVDGVPEVKKAALATRRIGLGIMGLGDMLYKLRIAYGSAYSIAVVGSVMEFIRYHSMTQSVKLAKERGVFSEFRGSVYDGRWEPPQRPTRIDALDNSVLFGRGDIDWCHVIGDMKEYGIRNATQLTVAPTGTIATVAGCEGYGCEPIFALGYIRHFKDGDKDVELVYTSPLFESALDKQGLSEQTKQDILNKVAQSGSCQDIDVVLFKVSSVFVTSADVTPKQHVAMQAEIQKYVDNSISKTCNFPAGATLEDVEDAYLNAWELGCKGLTVYVEGSREEVVLETKNEKDRKNTEVVNTKRKRPYLLDGYSYKKETPLGTAYVSINSTEDSEPFEVFINISKCGSDVAAVSEAMGRLVSLMLRMPSTLTPTERLQCVSDEMSGIGGGRSLGFGNDRVRSLPDGIAQVLADHLGNDNVADVVIDKTPNLGYDLCPDCGDSTLVLSEGCRKCSAFDCGYAEC